MSKNDETIFRVVKGTENPYAQVSKTLIRDSRLSWGTRAITDSIFFPNQTIGTCVCQTSNERGRPSVQPCAP